MARGWESKSIEQQIEDARTEPNPSLSLRSLHLDTSRRQKREGLLLQRSRILQEIATAHSPRYREMLNEMLRHLDRLIEQNPG